MARSVTLGKLPLCAFHSIETLGQARDFLKGMHDSGFSFHWEDSAESIISAETGEDMFTPLACDVLERRRAELYAIEWPDGDCPCGETLRLMAERGELPEVVTYESEPMDPYQAARADNYLRALGGQPLRIPSDDTANAARLGYADGARSRKESLA